MSFLQGLAASSPALGSRTMSGGQRRSGLRSGFTAGEEEEQPMQQQSMSMQQQPMQQGIGSRRPFGRGRSGGLQQRGLSGGMSRGVGMSTRRGFTPSSGGEEDVECLKLLDDLSHDHYRDVFHADLAKSLLVQRNFLPIREVIEAYLAGETVQMQQQELLQLVLEHYAANVAIDAVLTAILEDHACNREFCDVVECCQQGMPYQKDSDEVCMSRWKNAHIDAKLQAVVRQFYLLGQDLGSIIIEKYNPQSVDDLEELGDQICADICSYFEQQRSGQGVIGGGMRGGGLGRRQQQQFPRRRGTQRTQQLGTQQQQVGGGMGFGGQQQQQRGGMMMGRRQMQRGVGGGGMSSVFGSGSSGGGFGRQSRGLLSSTSGMM